MIRHPVDTPVTALDDSDDDVIFRERDDDVVDELDYEFSPPTWQERLRQWWKPRPSPPAYEMVNMDGGNPSLPPPPAHPLKNAVNRTFKGTLALFGTVLVGVIIAFVIVVPPGGGSTPQFRPLEYETVSNGTHRFKPTTILVSLDGFHPHYISQEDTPTLNHMYINGYLSPYMTPSFPSSTFPNHWTLITGLYPGDHGIVGNTFWDPERKLPFVNTNPEKGSMDPDFWRGGEPIWKTAELHGVKAAVHMWPGLEVPEVGAPLHDKFNASEELGKKIDRIMGWIDLPDDDRPQLLLAYVPTVDTYGHKYGIAGPELKQALTATDGFVGELLHQLEQRQLRGLVNVVVTSDHGMAPTSLERTVFLDDLVNLDDIDHIDGWPNWGLRPREGVDLEALKANITRRLQELEAQDNYDVYHLDEVPDQFHFGVDSVFSYRMAPLWIFPHVSYSVVTRAKLELNGGELKPIGVHGYNNTELLMRAIFLAEGPYFSSNRYPLKFQPFENVNVYPVVCDSLGMKPAANNGTRVLTKLAPGWMDLVAEYPGLPFDVDHLVVKNNTYDYLYRTPQRKTLGQSAGGLIDGALDTLTGWGNSIGHWFSGDKGPDKV